MNQYMIFEGNGETIKMAGLFKQTLSGTWHLTYMSGANCYRFKRMNWSDLPPRQEKDLPDKAKVCKKCLVNNR